MKKWLIQDSHTTLFSKVASWHLPEERHPKADQAGFKLVLCWLGTIGKKLVLKIDPRWALETEWDGPQQLGLASMAGTRSCHRSSAFLSWWQRSSWEKHCCRLFSERTLDSGCGGNFARIQMEPFGKVKFCKNIKSLEVKVPSGPLLLAEGGNS